MSENRLFPASAGASAPHKEKQSAALKLTGGTEQKAGVGGRSSRRPFMVTQACLQETNTSMYSFHWVKNKNGP